MLNAVDFFCGGGGMSLGLSKAGIRILAGIDNDSKVQSTYTANHKNSQFFLEDVSTFAPQTLEKNLRLKKNDDNLILVACSPCQYWSLIKTDKKKSKKTGFLLENFQRFVEYFEPGYVLIENVPGLNKNHESPINNFKSSLLNNGYQFEEGVLNCNDYGVPQHRLRYVLIASRRGSISLPSPRKGAKPVLRNAIGKESQFQVIPAGNMDPSGNFHKTCALSELNLKRIQATPKNGGNRLSWKDNPELQLRAYKGKDHYFRDVYGRMWWDRPAPTMTTKFISYSNGRFGHPEQDRALSVREGAAVQSFPKSFKIKCDYIMDASRIIGNAVPPKFAQALGEEICRVAHERD